MNATEQIIRACAAGSESRFEFWIEFIRATGIRRMAEVGVYRGNFAARILRGCDSLKKYYMIDPWRHLEGWNKPANKDDALFQEYLSEAAGQTEFAADRRTILRGKTTEVIDQIPDGELDFAYIDGDHTLKGITIDLILLYPKVREGGFLGGDDFTSTIWQHPPNYEPTLVFPYAVHFAEAVGARIYGLPHDQFCLEKTAERAFAFVDLTGQYGDLSLLHQLPPGPLLHPTADETGPPAGPLARIVRTVGAKLRRPVSPPPPGVVRDMQQSRPVIGARIPERHFVSYPKSGRTWIRFILTQLDLAPQVRFHHDRFEFCGGQAPHDFAVEERLRIYANVEKLVYLERDPRDVMVSLYHQITGRMKDVYSFKGNISEFLRDDYFGAHNLLRFRQMWAEILSSLNFLQVTYEECHEDIDGVMRRILSYYGFTVDPGSLAWTIAQARFSKMKDLEKSGNFPEPWLKVRNDAPKLRLGEVGGFRQALGEDDIAYLNHLFGA